MDCQSFRKMVAQKRTTMMTETAEHLAQQGFPPLVFIEHVCFSSQKGEAVNDVTASPFIN